MKVRQSFFLDMNLTEQDPEAKEIIKLLYQQFYSGSDHNATDRCHNNYIMYLAACFAERRGLSSTS